MRGHRLGPSAIVAVLTRLGHHVNAALQRLGFAARFFVMLLLWSSQSFRRLHLTIREIYLPGFQSLLIIMVSGLFIGMVLGMQGYETLQRYGSADALGVLVALSLVRELGPVVAALLFRLARRFVDHGRNRADESDRATHRHGHDGGQSDCPCRGPAFLGRCDLDALAGGAFSATGVFGGYLIGVVFIGVDEGAFWSQMQASVDFRYDIWSGIVKSFVFGIAVSLIAVFEGYDAQPTAEGVSSSIKGTVVKSALAILSLDFVLTSFMFREA
jgi:phospholipid/cholesterol/gamma-HCH transport system permease protein